MDIIEKRRKENWNIIFWLTPRKIILQIEPCLLDGSESLDNPCVDVEFDKVRDAINYARKICKRDAKSVRSQYTPT